MTPAKQHSRGHRNIIATSARHQQSITKTRPRHHRDTPRHHGDKTETRPRHVREHEFFNLEASSVDIWATATRKGAQSTNSNWNLRFCLETQSKCSSMFITKKSKHHHQSKKNSTATSTTQHQAITHSSSKHHSTITTHHGDFTEHARDVTNTSLKGRKTNKTTPKQPRDITKKNRDRDMAETSQRHHQNNTETSPRQDRDKTKKGPRRNRDMTETSPRQDRHITETRKHHRSTYGPQLHWFAQRCTIYKFKLEFEILLKNPVKMFISVHHQKIKTQSPKQKKSTATSTTKHQAITHSSS